jgi:hypothetical protein
MRGVVTALLLAALASGCAGKPAAPNGGGPEGVSFSVNPPDAEVLIDNVLQGKAVDFPDSRPLKVAVGAHVLELRAPGYLAFVRQLAVSRQPKKIEATLPRREEPPPKDKNGGAQPPGR